MLGDLDPHNPYRQVSSSMILVAMGIKGTIPTLLHFFDIFLSILLPNFGQIYNILK